MKNIIITGTSRGIGFELVQQLASQGHNILALSRHSATIEALNLPNVHCIPSDITLKESGQQQQLQADNLGNVITLYSFYQGKDKRTHSYQVTRNADQQITQVIGLRYTSIKDYERYRKAYVDFKKSLKRYAAD